VVSGSKDPSSEVKEGKGWGFTQGCVGLSVIINRGGGVSTMLSIPLGDVLMGVGGGSG
jgi:hypothetical protein